MPNIHFTCKTEDSPTKTVEAKPGQKLWDFADQGIVFVKEGNCGGMGRCKACKCRVDGKDELSCQTRVRKEDITVETLTYYNG